jgi:hypothetical protein
MTEQKEGSKPSQRARMRRSSSRPLGRTAATIVQRAYSGPELPVTIGTTLLGYFVFVIKSEGFEALTPERISLGMFPDAMPAVQALFEQLFPMSKSN